MRKAVLTLCLLASLVSFSSCAKEEVSPEEPVQRYVTFAINVGVDTTETVTKTSMDGGTGTVKWSASDVLTIHFVGVTVESVVTGTAQNISSDGRSATFTYTVPAEDSISARYAPKYLCYGDRTITLDKNKKPQSITIPSTQTFAGTACFADGENVSVGYMKGGIYDVVEEIETAAPDSTCIMKNIFGILKVNVKLSDTGKIIDYVQLTDNHSGNYLAGEFSFTELPTSKTGSKPVISHKSGTGGESLSIIKKVTGNVNGGDFYFLVPPDRLFTSDGFNLYVYTRDGYYAGKKIKLKSGEQASIERSVVTTVSISEFKPKDIPTTLPNTANSYIVPAVTGPYSIPAQYMGNGYQGNRNVQFADSTGTFGPESYLIEGAVSAEVVWQGRLNGDAILAGEVVSDAVYFTKDGYGYVGFHRSGVEGDALVAVKDASGTILWSWHLWVVDQEDMTDIEAGEWMYAQYGRQKPVFQIMDRNLGALSADPSALSQFHGLAYQYGRKDPYMGTRFSGPNSATGYESFATIYPGTAISCITEAVTVERSIKEPQHRVVPSAANWCVSTVYWGDPNGVASNDSPKTLYDPCPAGWRTFEEKNLSVVLGVDSQGKIARPVGEVVTSGDGYAFMFYNVDSLNVRHPVYFPGSGFSVSTTEVTQIGKIAPFWGANYITGQGQATSSQANYVRISMESPGTTVSSYTSDILHQDMYASMPVRCQRWTEPEVAVQPTPDSAAVGAEAEELELVTIK